MTDRRPDPSGDPGHSQVGADIWPPLEMPDDVRRMGLTRNTVEGAWVEFAANLNPRKPSHRLVAWVVLAIFVVPLLLSILDLLG